MHKSLSERLPILLTVIVFQWIVLSSPQPTYNHLYIVRSMIGYRDEEHLKLNIIAAFLPPLSKYIQNDPH